MNKLLLFIIVIGFSVPGIVVYAAQLDSLFQSSDILDITLTAPFARIDRERDKEKKYKDATLSYVDGSGMQIVLDVELEVRGNYRLQKDICRYSQLWVEFDSEQIQGTLFEDQDKLKLVLQCRSSNRYANYLVKEQQTYQLFNLMSEYSFATRMLRVTYVDNQRRNSSRTHYAFFIEHQKRLAKRLGMETVDLSNISVESLDSSQASLVSMFMYFIANTDYSLISGEAGGGSCCHNTKLVESEEGKYFVIPYDFDASGFVNVSYMTPDPKLRIRNNRQRLFRGYCQPDDILAGTLARFSEQRQAVNTTVSDTSFLNPKVAEKSADYMEAFYEIIDDPERISSQIIARCRGNLK